MENEFNIPSAEDFYLKLKKDYDEDLKLRIAAENQTITDEASVCINDILSKLSNQIQSNFDTDTKQFIVDYSTEKYGVTYTLDGFTYSLAIATRINKEFSMRGYVVNQNGTKLCIIVPSPENS